MEKVVISWSGGKDSALALQSIILGCQYEIASLMTTVNAAYGRINMHGVRRSLLQQQATSLGIPLLEILLPLNITNEAYGSIMGREMRRLKEANIRKVVFGDLFLEDVRKYREENLKKVGMEAVFPLWGRPTRDVVEQFLQAGFKAIVTCVDTTQLDGSFAGLEINADFLANLPVGVDPCGENGEFHTFVFDGPIFSTPVQFSNGDIVLRDDRFMFADLNDVQEQT
ncbi:MAG TPA: diphthine--ammonia ligase [Candidatus Lokiarchaeia archaeon]|nr:diphthine--ammonia ligase [Candidatus Lokiarchaeia archaeon]